MTRVAVVIDGQMTLYEQNGQGAVELARLRVGTVKPDALLALIAGLEEFLPRTAQLPRATGILAHHPTVKQAAPRQPRPAKRGTRADKKARALAYVTAHPGSTIAEIARDGLGLLGGQGAAFHALLREAGLRLEKEASNTGRHKYRWVVFPPGGAK